VRGSHPEKLKEERLQAFSDGKARIIISKPRVAGFGLNWQHCHETIFAGVSYSFEEFYQALGRFNRYGQTKQVRAHLIYAETEGDIMETLKDKQQAFAEMQAEMTAAMLEHGLFRDSVGGSGFSTADGAHRIIIPGWFKTKGQRYVG
jgi:superfamily II DNA or RNA helicase